MARRRTTQQKDHEEYLESTYIIRKKVSKHDLGIINQPKYYPKSTKKDRNYNNGVDHAIEDLKLIHFMLVNLKPMYRSKIIHSDHFKSVMEQVMEIGVSKFHKMTKQEKDESLAFSVQMLNYCLRVIAENMPIEFRKPLVTNMSPVNDLLEAIYKHMKKTNKSLPFFKKMPLAFTEGY